MKNEDERDVRGYASVAEEDGVNYRDIADTMSILGYDMNHSSARNHVIRVMRKFVSAYAKEWNIGLGDVDVDEIARSPEFQAGMADILHSLWSSHEDDSIFTVEEDEDQIKTVAVAE